MVNKELSRVVLQLLGDIRLVEQAKAVGDLRAHIQAQNAFIGEILQATGTSRRQRLSVPEALENCNFCYYPVKRGEGGVCPCGGVGYCSSECQALDWTRHHRRVCGARDTPYPSERGGGCLGSRRRTEDESSIERVD
jgi:hypothetical protein